MASSSEEGKAYMDSLFSAGSVPTGVNNSVRIVSYFAQLDKILASAIGFKEKGELEQAFVAFLKYVNLGMVVKNHNAYTAKTYERDMRGLERKMPTVIVQMESLKPQLLERQQRAAAEPEPLPPALAAALLQQVWEPEPEPEPEVRQVYPSAPPLAPAARSGGGGSGGGGQARVVKIFGDGHCLYRSVAAALNPQIASLPRNDFGVIIDRSSRDLEEAAALSLRSRVAAHMEQNWGESQKSPPQLDFQGHSLRELLWFQTSSRPSSRMRDSCGWKASAAPRGVGRRRS